jgi:hypothetical protein
MQAEAVGAKLLSNNGLSVITPVVTKPPQALVAK